jgi:hypothetical protein
MKIQTDFNQLEVASTSHCEPRFERGELREACPPHSMHLRQAGNLTSEFQREGGIVTLSRIPPISVTQKAGLRRYDPRNDYGLFFLDIRAA